jgi:hypothetical protein
LQPTFNYSYRYDEDVALTKWLKDTVNADSKQFYGYQIASQLGKLIGGIRLVGKP